LTHSTWSAIMYTRTIYNYYIHISRGDMREKLAARKHLCSEVEVDRYLRGKLQATELAAVEAHLTACTPCQSILGFARTLLQVLRGDSSRELAGESCPDSSLIVGLEAERLDKLSAKHVTAHLLHCKRCREAYLMHRLNA